MKKFIKKCIPVLIPILLIDLDFTFVKGSFEKLGQLMDFQDNNKKLEDAIADLKNTRPYPHEGNFIKECAKVEDCDTNYDLYTKIGKKLDQSFLKEKKPENEVDFYFLVMAYVRFLSDYAAKANVKLPANCVFGFDAYVNKDTVPSKNILDDLYKQSKMLAKILVLLFDANDHGMTLKSIVREGIVDTKAKDKKNSGKGDTAGTLDVNKMTIARVSGPKSYLISLEFECYTSALRRFLNLLQEYNLPVLIRDFDITSSSKETQKLTTSPIDVKLIFEWVFPRPKVTKTVEDVLPNPETTNEGHEHTASKGSKNLKPFDAKQSNLEKKQSKPKDSEVEPKESNQSDSELEEKDVEPSDSGRQKSGKKKSNQLWFKQAEEVK